jgi:hypothetical protein
LAVQTPADLAAAPGRRPTNRSRLLAALSGLSRHPWLITAMLCAVLLALPPTGGDLAAQEFHTWVFKAHDAVLWNNFWYGGHLLGGYSLLFPPLAAVTGTRLLGALACVGAAAAAGALFGAPRGGGAARLASVWFAVGCLGPFLVGQVPFSVGVALGLAALLAAARQHPLLAGVAALAASLTSPLAGAFLLLVALAWCTEAGWRRTAPLATAALGVAAASVLGGGGFFPFPPRALLILLLFALGGVVLIPSLSRTMRVGLLLYAASAVAIFAVHNPVGGNMGRIGALVGGPLAAYALGTRRRWRSLAVVAIPLLCWQMWPLGTAVTRSFGDPSSHAAYYAGLDDFLRTQDVAQGRLEIPNLRQHWESYYVPKVFPIARGWERQIDLRDNEILYHPDLTAEQLHDWVLRSGVGLIALPDAPIDYWSTHEAALLRAGQPWLRPVWSDAHWQVWRVTDATGLVTGPARLTELDVDSFQLAVDRAGASVVRVHWSPYWQVTSGSACLRPGPDGWVTVEAASPGPVSVTARWSLSAASQRGSADGRCH